MAFGNVISAAGGGRYTVGWYACRLSWRASACVLLLYFLAQFVRQHGLLVRTTGDLSERTRERDRIWSVSEDLLGVSTFEGYFICHESRLDQRAGLGRGRDQIDACRARCAIPMMRRTRWPDARGSLKAYPRCAWRTASATRTASWRWVAWTMTAERGLIYVAGRHVTAEREAQEALRKAEADAAHRQKMEALGQLTGGVAHDFNNLLMVVSRFHSAAQGRRRAAMARRRQAAAGDRDGRATRRGTHAPAAELRAPPADQSGGRRHWRARSSPCASILKSTLGSFIELRLEVEPALWPVRLDANELELALLNLVLNARDAMPQKSDRLGAVP